MFGERRKKQAPATASNLGKVLTTDKSEASLHSFLVIGGGRQEAGFLFPYSLTS